MQLFENGLDLCLGRLVRQPACIQLDRPQTHFSLMTSLVSIPGVEVLTSAARMILPHFLTTGSKALRSDKRSNTNAMLKMNSFLS